MNSGWMTTSDNSRSFGRAPMAFLLAVALCAFVMPSAAGAAQNVVDGAIASPEPDWPQWRGIRRDGISDEKGLLQEWPEEGPPLLWKFEGLGEGWSSPIVVGDLVYITGDIGDDCVIFAIDHQGNVRWSVKNGEAWKRSYPGSRASCAYSEGRLYHINAHGRLVCLDALTGEEIWVVNVLERFEAENITWAISECLLIDGPRVLVTPGGNKTLMAALDKFTGETVWMSEPIEGELASYSSPLLFAHEGRRLIANCSSRHGFGIDAETGELLWTVPMTNRYLVQVAQPVYDSGNIFYVTSYAEDGRLYRLKPDGDGFTTEHLWTVPVDCVTGTPLLVDGVLHAAGYKSSTRWWGFDWETGETVYEYKELTTGVAIYADNRLYILDERGNVALMEPTRDGLERKGHFKLSTRRINDAWAHPVVFDGRLYLRYKNTLWCYNVKQ